VYVIWEPEKEEARSAVSGGPVMEFLASHDTIKRSTTKPKRVVMLEKVITKLIEDGTELKDQLVTDVMAKIMEEMAESGSPRTPSLVSNPRTLRLSKATSSGRRGRKRKKAKMKEKVD
jgi:hypothetical protein